MKTIGVLALQGSFHEHISMLEKIGDVKPVAVKTLKDLDASDGLIIPGGESTTIGKLLREFGLLEPLKNKITGGMPVWGTCAGLILLAKKISSGEPPHLGVMDITVKRNAYGGQLESFTREITITEVSNEPIKAVFIRAPLIESVGDGVTVLARVDGNIAAAQQGKILATAFHPELTDDLSFYRYFADML